MIHIIKKKLQLLFKRLSYSLFKLLYGEIKDFKPAGKDDSSEVLKSILNNNFTYKVYKIQKARLYTDTINDTAVIQGNKIVEGPSFQIRNVKFDKINTNIVFSKGTPRLKKKISGRVFAMLTGGAGNYNYFHWLFDVLPRFKILSNVVNINEIDYFLLPDTKKKFQRETLDIFGISPHMSLSSLVNRHIECDEILTTDHPWVIQNEATSEIQNLPSWIISWLKKTFTSNFDLKDINYPKKIYILRSDALPNIQALRRITNEESVIDQVKKNNYKPIVLSDYSFKEQMKFFYNADEIIGLHGAGFANLVFTKSGSKVLELKPSTAGMVINNLAKQCNLEYDSISVVPEKHAANNQMGHINIDINLLKEKIK